MGRTPVTEQLQLELWLSILELYEKQPLFLVVSNALLLTGTEL